MFLIKSELIQFMFVKKAIIPFWVFVNNSLEQTNTFYFNCNAYLFYSHNWIYNFALF